MEMVSRKIRLYWCFVVCCAASISANGTSVSTSTQVQQEASTVIKKKKSSLGSLFKPRRHAHTSIVHGFIRNVVQIHAHLFTLSSVKIIAATAPLYAALRIADDAIQCKFVDVHRGCDINQLPKECHDIAKYSLGVPIATFIGYGLFARKNKKMIETSRVFLAGMPFVIFGKDLIKKLHFDMCKRPKCARFDMSKDYYGGFPSGHMAEVIYMAVLYGKRYGFKAAVPLGALGAFVAGVFLNCNRHYASQLVAGAGLGAMYGVAAHTVADIRIAENYSFELIPDKRGISLGFRF